MPGWCVTPAPFASLAVPVGNRQQVTHLPKYPAFPCNCQDLSRQRFLAPDGVCIPTSNLAERTGTFVCCRSAYLYFLQLFTAMLLDCHHPGYTAALTPVSAPLLWASARQGAAGGGIADLEALSICHYMSCSIRRRCTRTSIAASDCNLGEFQRDWSNLEPNRSPPLSLFLCFVRQPTLCTWSIRSILAARSRTVINEAQRFSIL